MGKVVRYGWACTGMRPASSGSRYVRQSDYDALSARLARVEGMLERAIGYSNHASTPYFMCDFYIHTDKECACGLDALRAEYAAMKEGK